MRTALAAVPARLREAPGLVPGLVALSVFFVWAFHGGGYAATVWYPGALLLLALLGVVALAFRGLVRDLPRPVLLASAFLSAFTVWSYLSIFWSGVKGDAWDGANRTLLYLTVYALFAWLPWRPWAAGAALGALSLAATATGAIVIWQASTSSDPSTFFIGARLSDPLGYANALCALFLMALWPALYLASRRGLPALLRGVFLAAAGILVELALLCQSRGSLFAAPVVVALYLAVVPGRVRSVLALGSVAAVAGLARGTMLAVYPAAQDGDLHAALLDARRTLGLSALVLLGIGTAVALVDRPRLITESLARRAGWALAAIGVVAVLAGSALLLTLERPTDRVAQGWREFTAGQTSNPEGSYLTGGLGSNRYDFWRVAVKEVVRAPVVGVGVDNFAIDYLRERRSLEEPLYPHSLELRVLAQTGIVGAALFLGFLLLALAAVWRAGVRSGPGAGLAATAVVVFGYWLVHGSVDWFWEAPVLGGIAFAALGLAARARGADPERSRARSPRPGNRLLLGALVAAVAVAGVCSYALPWLSAEYVSQAAESWPADPDEAFDRLDRARRLNPLSDQPDLIAGAIAARLDDRARMRRSFRRALVRNPWSWYARLELAVVESSSGRREPALRQLNAARRLDPLEPTIQAAIREVHAGRQLSQRELERTLLERAAAREK